MKIDDIKLRGLTSNEAAALEKEFGRNELVPEKKESFFKKALDIVSEPMFLLLIAAAVIYFVLGEARDGAIMLVFVLGIIGIDIVQEWKTDKTLAALKSLSAPQVRVLRDGAETVLPSAELVPGDVVTVAEGDKIPADGFVARSADLCVDESILTGESSGVWKLVCGAEAKTTDAGYWKKDYCYAGTLVTQGSATLLIDKTGLATEYGKIGASVAASAEEQTPLQKQTDSLVRTSAFIAAALFLLVGLVTWFNLPLLTTSQRVIKSVLSGITLAMAMIPEEFPVILTVFLSMGAWRLAKKRSLVRRLPSVETLGAVSVLCVDKTGTITENRMTVSEIVCARGVDEDELIETTGLGCESETYDPMEKAMLAFCEARGYKADHLFGGSLVTEFPFTNEQKMMGHVWRHDGGLFVAAKGSPERILSLCGLSKSDELGVQQQINDMASRGLRVIAVGSESFEDEACIPASLADCRLRYLGLIGLLDPPRESVKQDIALCRKAGIRVVMITGDSGLTASSIARMIGMDNAEDVITGDELDAMCDEQLAQRVKTASIFSRVVPAHKMRIVSAFRAGGDIVAMTGDGVNDAPALKAADIGVAMGQRGSEVAREASDLILLDDNFSTIVDTVRDGRRIYDNIRKAVCYVFSIHVPIALASLCAPLLKVPTEFLLLLPLHVMLLELIIDPTCSIVLERQPAERDIMSRPPRDPNEQILPLPQLLRSLLQGAAIFAASFGCYFYMLTSGGLNDANAAVARSMGLCVVIFANLFLVLVYSSSRDFAFSSLGRLMKDKLMWVVLAAVLLMTAAVLYTPLNVYLKLSALSATQLFVSFGLAFASVFWYELVKLSRHLKEKRAQR